MKSRNHNPFLVKSTAIRWRKGPFAKEGKCSTTSAVGAPIGDDLARRSEDDFPKRMARDVPAVFRAHPTAGTMDTCGGSFLGESNSGWGSNLDMLALVHGPVGCGVFTQTSRLNLPGLLQGVETFSALHACTDMRADDLTDGGDARLEQSLDEAHELFPLASGTIILSEDPIALIDSNVAGIAKAKRNQKKRLVISVSCESIKLESTRVKDVVSTLKAAASYHAGSTSGPYDVALPFFRGAAGLLWIVSKLLQDIGLNPIHQFTGSSSRDMALIGNAKLVLGFAEKSQVPAGHMPTGYAQLLRRWSGIPLAWTCFVNPSATDASLRTIAQQFDFSIRKRTEQVIEANHKKIDATIARFRPRLEGKLLIHFCPMTEEQLEPYRLLGFRIGNASGWIGKTGIRRTPRVVCDTERPNPKAIDAYLAEAKPDVVLSSHHGRGRSEYDWLKRGLPTLHSNPYFDQSGNSYWAYDGFVLLADALDRAVNAPWRKIIKAPWTDRGPS